jgi:hypothetical protein
MQLSDKLTNRLADFNQIKRGFGFECGKYGGTFILEILAKDI